jgi:acyl transferase domain-containing protein/NAD(P)-dependent dehydrogenase (short-subunit alcohol dehydrogenase family)/acyl carrier protein
MLWEHVREGKELIEEVSRWDSSQLNYGDENDCNAYCRFGSFLPRINEFDPSFFNISGMEATFMDPQQRFFLEESWKALEDAGYVGDSMRGKRCGVYVGHTGSDYDLLFTKGIKEPSQAFWGNAGSIIPARVSYCLDLQGPAIAIDTACSGSLVAFHLACQSLWIDEIEMALAGGVFIQSTPKFYRLANRAHMLSPSGHCYAFDQRADGFVPGEGVGVAVLKRLHDAIKDGDHIYGVIRGSGTNQDGKTNGIIAPSAASQEKLLSSVYDTFQLNPEKIQLVEAHGTGTKLGDPIEFSALTRAFRRFTNKNNYCAVGSVKTNIGHTAAAAGVAGVIKVLLAFQNKTLPPSPTFHKENNEIQIESSPFYINTEAKPWSMSAGEKRCAAVSSFGFSGTNAHLVIEEMAENRRISPAKPVYLFVFSARTMDQLRQIAQRMISFLKSNRDTDIGNLSYTLIVGRKTFNCRLACVAKSVGELISRLENWHSGEGNDSIFIGELWETGLSGSNDGMRLGNVHITNCLTASNEDEYVENLSILARMFVENPELPLGQLFNPDMYGRISLPTYPFAKEGYWVCEDNRHSEDVHKKESVQIDTRDQGKVLAAVRPGGTESRIQVESKIHFYEEVLAEVDLPVCVQIEAKTLVIFSSRTVDQNHFKAAFAKNQPMVKLIFVAQSERSVKLSDTRYDLESGDVCAMESTLSAIIQDHGPLDGIFYAWPIEEPFRFQDYIPLIRIVQSNAKLTGGAKRIVIVGQYTNGIERCYLEALIGLERSIGMVVPTMHICLAIQEVSPKEKGVLNETLLDIARRTFYRSEMKTILWLGGKAYAYQVRPKSIEREFNYVKSNGTYLITGGAGALGLLTAKYFACICKVNIVLLGRSNLAQSRREEIESIEGIGSRILYLQADICNRDDVENVLKRIEATFGKVSGVVHAAGICLDTSILNKNEDEFLRVLSPKMAGTSLLDELIDDSALDFVCYFSSSSAILGDFGFCDYAIGNRFLMAYGIQRNRLVQEGLKRGRTIVINWPMWKDGNMGFVDSEQAEGYLKLSGQQYLESTVGMQILDTILSNSGSQAMVLVGEKSKIRELVKGKTIRELPERSMTDPSLKRRGDESGVGQNLQEELVRIVGEILLIKQEKISVDTIFADLGFDSLSLASFAEALSKHFSVQISPATFFGHSTIKSLATYLFDTHGAEIVQRLQRVYPPSTIIPDEKNTPPPEVPRETEASIKVIKPESLNEPIAIIGMSGRFPGADNVDSLWQLFFTGRDAISDIPPQRLALGNFKTNHQGAPHGLRCGWLSDVDMFDSSFFEITPLEAEGMDPRQRILLQEAWNALENAGYGPRLLEKGKIGMFVGVEDGDYYAAGEKPSLVTSNHNGILASRLAYFLNFHGPVMAINTACSSGLVAVHQACLSLRNNECEVALASGANILFSHQAFEGMTNVGMLSKDGICRAFDRGANGTVPGEAVAVVVLKKLGKAIEDGNQILAVIKASGINYDGKTNGITAPSHVSQAQLLKDIYSSLDISGDGIQYVIAHGTGTKLGDPVEILALNEAFSSLTARKKFCAVTSTKPTLGHSMATSGIVNLICMISALKNQCIPASLNCTHENELVNWEDSAVYINKEAKSWPENSNGKRIGAVSAFGMSGTNAHLVIEGYTERKINSSSSNERPFPCILCLSAKTPEALKRKVLDMIDFLKRRSNGYSLRELSFTLLEGRHHFDFRVAAVVNTIEHAIQTLEKSIAGEKPENVFEGTKAVGFVEQHALKRLGALIAVEIGGDKSRDGTKCLENLQVLADLYRKGYTIDWRQLFAENPPDSICLPTYPFQKNHHWKSNPAQSGKTRAIADENKGLHPLVHRNTATLSQFRFSSSFSGSEPYISDHNVNGSKTIPGVAFMEMALAATILSDESNSGVAGTCFENIIWGEIAKCEGRLLDIDVLLYPKNDGSLSYNIRGANTGNVQGRDFSKGIIRKKRIDEDDNVDIEKIKSECGIAHVNHDQFYMFCLEMGFEYGERYRGVRNVYVGRNEVLAEIAILQTADESCDRYLLNPGLIDSSLQASICLFFDTNKMGITMPIEGALPVPNALKAFSIYTNIFPNKLWSRIRFSDPKRQAGRQRVIDIEIFNEKGVLIAKFEELTIHFHNMSLTAMQTPESSNAVMMTPLWKYAESVTVFSTSGNVQHVIVLCGLSRIQSSIVKSFHPQTDVITIGSQEERLDKLFGDYASKIFSIIKKQLTVHSDDQVIVQVMYGMDDRHGILAGMQGLLRTAHKENPRFIGQLIGVPINLSDSEAVAIIRENLQCRIELCVRYKDNHRFALDWEECIHAPIQVGSWQSESIYLITGGAGMLGLVLAESIARGSRNSKIILVGRSDLSQEKKDRIDKLSKNPVRIKYMNADISDAAETNQIVDSILREHGRLDVIIHCAGITNDNFIIKKNSAEFERVLAPKVNGLVNIDEASKNLRIQQFILFSSASAVLGNVGQSDYATANAFMDEFVTFRTEMVRLGERFGHTISINWPLWNHGGMGMDQIEANVYSQKYGAVGLESSTGIELLLRCMALELNRVMILPNAINQLEKAKTAPIQNTDANSENKYKVKRKIEAIEERVKRAIASTTKLDINAIHSEVQFEKFGVDSIAQAQIVEELEREFGELPKTLLFEYRTTREVAGYLTDHRAFDLKQSESIPDTDIAVDRKTDSVEEEISFINETTQESGLGVQAENISPLRNDPGDVAIIGMSGCYPHSLNLEKLWENLVAGRNCIEAFPEYRMQSGLLGRIQKDVSQKERFYGGFLSNVQEFDRDVFEIEESQVAELPLELRLLLKIAWETFEDAGYTKAGLKSAQDKWNNGVGVYVGCMYNQNYLNANTLEEASRMSNLTDWQIANRISYHFGLTGPSLSVNTACSSSLTAIHLAYEALKANNCCMAIASGVNLSLDRSKFEVLRKRNLLATGKVSKSLGDGDGFLPGEGAGAVLLKPYSLARADRDRIYAVIKSSSLNHAGDRQAFGSPDPIRQANLIINSLTRSGVDPETISYVESAANGSDLGDAVEFRALCKAFAHFTAKKQFCAIGSVKSNIGHLEAASGIAQLTKVLLQMCNETLVPSINAKPINPNVNMQESPFFLQDELSPWTERSIPDSKERIPRRSMINSFGAGGAYANVIVEHVQRSQKLVVLHGHLQPCEQLFLFSAKTKDSLMDYLARMERFLSAHAEESLKNIAYTLWRNCHEFAQRIAIVAGSIDDLHRKLEIALHNTEMDGECDVYRTPSFPIVTDGTEPGHVLNNMDLRRMASLWVGGAAIDISNLYRGEEFEVISLPKYSFCPPVGLMNEGKGFGLSKCQLNDIVQKVVQGEITECQFVNAILAIRGSECIAS